MNILVRLLIVLIGSLTLTNSSPVGLSNSPNTKYLWAETFDIDTSSTYHNASNLNYNLMYYMITFPQISSKVNRVVMTLENIYIEPVDSSISFQGYILGLDRVHFSFFANSLYPRSIKKLTYRYLMITDQYLNENDNFYQGVFQIQFKQWLSSASSLSGQLSLSPPMNVTGGVSKFISLTGFTVVTYEGDFQLSLKCSFTNSTLAIVSVTTTLEQTYVY